MMLWYASVGHLLQHRNRQILVSAQSGRARADHRTRVELVRDRHDDSLKSVDIVFAIDLAPSQSILSEYRCGVYRQKLKRLK